LKYSYKDKE